MMSAKTATLCLLKIKVFSNNCYYVIKSVYYATKTFLPSNSNYIVDLVT